MNGGCIFFAINLSKPLVIPLSFEEEGALPIPIDVLGKEWVFLDLVPSIRAQPMDWIALEQSSHHVLCFISDSVGEGEGI